MFPLHAQALVPAVHAAAGAIVDHFTAEIIPVHALPVPNAMRAELRRWHALAKVKGKGSTVERAAQMETLRIGALLAGRLFGVVLTEDAARTAVAFSADFSLVWMTRDFNAEAAERQRTSES